MFSAYRRRIGGDDEPDLIFAHRPLDVFAVRGSPLPVQKDAGSTRAAVDGDGLALEVMRQPLRDPVRRVVILAEDDAAPLQPALLL